MAVINVVPYIDVMLVLLVIFMATTPLLSQGVKVNLPQAPAQAIVPKQDPLIVSMDAHNLLYVNVAVQPDKPLTEAQLLQTLYQQQQKDQQKKIIRQVFIKADEKLSYGRVMSVMVLLQKAGVLNLGLITEPPSTVHLP